MEIRYNEPLSKHTTFKIGGPARVMVIVRNLDELLNALEWAHREGWPTYVIGGGSNLLVHDEGFPGMVIKMATSEYRFDDNYLIAQAGTPLATLLMNCMERGLSGIEFLAGIPGTLGGAIYMNAGLKKITMKDVVEEVEILNNKGEIQTLGLDELEFGYRQSRFHNTREIILGAKLRLNPENPETIRARVNDLIQKRKYRIPLEYPSGGSIFRNPANDYAGRLIEQCGLKGLQIGKAMISRKHANFIINLGGATFKDVWQLIEIARDKVKEQFDIELELEIEIL